MPADLDDALLARLRADLTDAAAGIEAPPSMPRRARDGGRRRLVRRRAGAAIALTVAAVTVAGALSSGPRGLSQVARWLDLDRSTTTDRGGGDVYGPLLARTPGGDLIHDKAYTDAVLRLWQDNRRTSPNADRGVFDDARGAATVVWAGSTPAGPAAVVVQRFFLHGHGNLGPDDWNRTRTLVGYVGVDAAGRPHLVGDDYGALGSGRFGGWWVDPGHTVLAVADVGSRVGYTLGPQVLVDGRVVPSFTEVRFAQTVALIPMASGTDWRHVRLSGLPRHGIDDEDVMVMWPLAGSSSGQPVDALPTEPATPPARLDWRGGWPIEGTHRNDLPSQPFPQKEFLLTLHAVLGGNSGRMGTWNLTGRLADGRPVVVGEFAAGDDPTHVYLEVLDPTGPIVVDGGVLDVRAVLPVIVRVPDRGGWIVGRVNATLRWRTGTGGWHPAGRDAALIPATATQVEVTPDGAAARIVTLPG